MSLKLNNYSVCLYLHIQGMNPSARSHSSTNLTELFSLVEEIETNGSSFVPFIGISESWLKFFISDAQIKIDNYDIVISDRKTRKNGGVL